MSSAPTARRIEAVIAATNACQAGLSPLLTFAIEAEHARLIYLDKLLRHSLPRTAEEANEEGADQAP